MKKVIVGILLCISIFTIGLESNLSARRVWHGHEIMIFDNNGDLIEWICVAGPPYDC